jgi:D-alanine-D-alanine ligase
MGKTINVGILFGGKSAEHEVSLQSAKNVVEAIDRKKYRPVLIGIDKSGRWFLLDEEEFLIHADNPKLIALNTSGVPAALIPQSGGVLSLFDVSGNSPEREVKVDVVFPILHGPFGEDGTIQGLLTLADVPYVGSGVLGSALGMDKDVMKRLLRDGGVPIGRFLTLQGYDPLPPLEEVEKELGLPFFIKPANMGSSVGVSKVHNEDEYRKARTMALAYDNKIILEEFISGRELECAVLGNELPHATLPGEIKSTHEFYSYEAKYLDENGAVLEIPAKLPRDKAFEIQKLAEKTARILSCEGLGRVDFFMKDDGTVLVNEINTIPGFTRISMYPKLWEEAGIPYGDLIDVLIHLAVFRYEKGKRLKTSRE